MKTKRKPLFQPVQNEEQRKKRRRNIIITTGVLVILAALTLFIMPKNKDISQSSVFDQAEVEKMAEQVVTCLNEEDFDSLKEMSVEDMASIMNKERIDEAKARVSEDWGDFQSITGITTSEVSQRGVTAAVAYVTADYENVEIHYTFAFNEDMKLASFGIQ